MFPFYSTATEKNLHMKKKHHHVTHIGFNII